MWRNRLHSFTDSRIIIDGVKVSLFFKEMKEKGWYK